MGSAIDIRDMQPEDEAFVGSCTHVNETKEWTASCERRIPWLRGQYDNGLRVKVALVDGTHAGFLYMMPSEMASWGLIGENLSVIQCLVSCKMFAGRGIGRALVRAAEDEARGQGRKGIAVVAFYHDFWFMPAPFFEHCGYAVVRRKDDAAVLWKPFGESVAPPDFLHETYRFVAAPGKVAVDLFWNRACLTSDTEASRVRAVVGELGDTVDLREYCTDDSAIKLRFGLSRAIYIDGKRVDWGYEAPKDGLRDAIRGAMRRSGIA